MPFLSRLFGKTKSCIINIFLLHRKDDLRNTIFCHLLIFCALSRIYIKLSTIFLNHFTHTHIIYYYYIFFHMYYYYYFLFILYFFIYFIFCIQFLIKLRKYRTSYRALAKRTIQIENWVLILRTGNWVLTVWIENWVLSDSSRDDFAYPWVLASLLH